MSKLLKILSVPLAIGGAGLIYLLEKRRPLRAETESKPRRNARNLLVSAAALATVQLLEKPVADKMTALVRRENVGLLKIFRLPPAFETLLAVLLLDYTLYLWHVLTHKVPLLWRFHLVHHTDCDLDASTAIRFHFGEIALSVLWRAAQIVVIGVSPEALRIWQTLLLPAIIFHHSNIDLPVGLDRKLRLFLVTPQMHGVHHSVVRAETDSNWSSGLSFWDRLHGTYLDAQLANPVTIGVPAFRDDATAKLERLALMPFEEPKDDRLENR
jgi:sterol desaturase/sphingolipid hydroxylase (fatty acid hydroxylase superfamily)